MMDDARAESDGSRRIAPRRLALKNFTSQVCGTGHVRRLRLRSRR